MPPIYVLNSKIQNVGTRSNGLTIYVLSKNKKKIRIFQMKITIFTAVKNRSILAIAWACYRNRKFGLSY